MFRLLLLSLIFLPLTLLRWLPKVFSGCAGQTAPSEEASRKQPVEEKPVKEKPVKEEPAKRKPAKEEPARAKTSKARSSTTGAAKEDDLRKIEGIGPKIAQTLHAAGIRSFAEVAASTPETLRQILDAAGIRIGFPDTWPEQARLAATGKWHELEALQARLEGGRRV